MAIKIYVSGNSLKIEDTATGKKLSRNKKDVTVYRDSSTSKTFVFLYLVNQYFVGNSDEFINSAGAAWANPQAFEDWAAENTGDCCSASGSGGAGGYVASPYTKEKVIFIEDTNWDPHAQNITACELYIEFTGSGGKFNGVEVPDGFGRGFGNNSDNLIYNFENLQAPLSGKITFTYGKKVI